MKAQIDSGEQCQKEYRNHRDYRNRRKWKGSIVVEASYLLPFTLVLYGIIGIMEMADGIVINKADGDNLERAKLAATQFRNALHLFPAPESGWTPQVLTYSGFYNIGVKEIWDMIYEYIDFVKTNGYFEYRRNEQSKYWMYETINEQLRDSFYHNPKIEAMLLEKEQQVLQGNLTSFIAAKSLLDTYFADLKRDD